MNRLDTVVSRLGTVFFLAITLLSPNPAVAKCHLFSVWHYPKPQRCFTALASLHHALSDAKPASRNHETSRERIDIPMPDLHWIDCPDGDERFQGIAKLHALMDAPRP